MQDVPLTMFQPNLLYLEDCWLLHSSFYWEIIGKIFIVSWLWSAARLHPCWRMLCSHVCVRSCPCIGFIVMQFRLTISWLAKPCVSQGNCYCHDSSVCFFCSALCILKTTNEDLQGRLIPQGAQPALSTGFMCWRCMVCCLLTCWSGADTHFVRLDPLCAHAGLINTNKASMHVGGSTLLLFDWKGQSCWYGWNQ